MLMHFCTFAGKIHCCSNNIMNKSFISYLQTRLVHLIHSMGGSIRKDMTSKVTHLICNTVGGEKYQYAMTFRLAVVRPNWVFDAWQKRCEPNFLSTNEEFTAQHRIKAFEGQRVCFFGFAPEDHTHMVNLLKSYGGIETTIDDPECSHVVSIPFFIFWGSKACRFNLI